MKPEIVALLKTKDTTRRKQGIMLAGRSKDASYIPILQKLAQIDPDPYLQTLADKAANHLRENADNAIKPLKKPASQTSAPTADAPTKKQGNLPKVFGEANPPADIDFSRALEQKRRKLPRKSRYSLGGMLIFGAFAILLVGLAVYVIYDRSLTSVTAMTARFESAQPMPLEGSAPYNLTGQIYRDRLTNYMTYTLFEPTGPTPPKGWPIIVVIHGNSMRAEIMATWHYRWTQEEGVILVTPQFDNTMYASNENAQTFGHLNAMMDTIEAYYSIDVDAAMISGFSWGSSVAWDYTSRYPSMFAGAVLGNMYYNTLVPRNSDVKYALFAGEDEGGRQYLPQTANAMSQQGTPLWYWEVIPNTGHEITQGQINKARELMTLLRYGDE